MRRSSILGIALGMIVGGSSADGQKIPAGHRARLFQSPVVHPPVASATNDILNRALHAGDAALGITVDEANDRVVVPDLFTGITYRYDRQLNLVDSIASPGGTNTHTGITYVDDGINQLLYWRDDSAQVIYETDLDGVVSATFAVGGAIAGMCYRSSTDTIIYDENDLDMYIEIDRAGNPTGFMFPNPEGSPALGNGISHDERDGFHITVGTAGDQVRAMLDLDSGGAIEAILWTTNAAPPDIFIESFDSFVNSHVFTTNGGTLGNPAEYINANATNSIVEMDVRRCGLEPITGVSCSAAGNDVTVTWTDNDAYSTVTILRNNAIVGAVAGGIGAFTDLGAPNGISVYHVTANDAADCADGGACEIAVGDISDLVYRPIDGVGPIDDAQAIADSIVTNGGTAAVVGALPSATLMSQFDRVWVLCGTYPDNHALSTGEGEVLTDLVMDFGVTVIQSGGDIWSFDAPTAFNSVDGAAGTDDGSSDLFFLNGLDTNLGFDLSGITDVQIDLEQLPITGNDWIDHLIPDLPGAGVMMRNRDNGDDVGIFYDAGDYTVLNTSFELGTVADSAVRDAIVERYMNGICTVAAPVNFTCVAAANDIQLTWVNLHPAGPDVSIEIRRDDTLIATVPGDMDTYSDIGVPAGLYNYRLRTIDTIPGVECGRNSPRCEAGIGVEFQTTCSTPFLGIPDGDPIGVSDPAIAFGSLSIVDVRVQVEIAHTFIGDLTVDLTSPTATTVRLYDQNGDDADNIDVVFNDNGIPIASAAFDCGCDMRPSGPGTLADFATESSGGSWILTVADNVLFDAGVLNMWCLTIVGVRCPVMAPADLACSDQGSDVDLTWTNDAGGYDEIEIFRDGVLLDTIVGSPESFTDTNVAIGIHTYRVRGIDNQNQCSGLSKVCTVTVGVTDLVWAHAEQNGGLTNDENAIVGALAANGIIDILIVNELPSDLSSFERIWVTLGTFDLNHTLTPAEGQGLRDYCLEAHGRLYVSGSDVWGFDLPTPFDDVDGVNSSASSDGGPPPDGLNVLSGLSSGQGLDLSGFQNVPFTGENAWIDHMVPDSGELIWTNPENGDPIGVVHHGELAPTSFPGDYRVISTSWELGGFGTPADQADVMAQYLAFFSGARGIPFIRADANGDGDFNGLSDGLFILNSGFVPGSPHPDCFAAADADGNREFNPLPDGLYSLNATFVPGSPLPPAPFPNCGLDPNGVAALTCDEYTCP